jgi:hypothetical protein
LLLFQECLDLGALYRCITFFEEFQREKVGYLVLGGFTLNGAFDSYDSNFVYPAEVISGSGKAIARAGTAAD